MCCLRYRVLHSKDALTYLSLVLRVDLLDPSSSYSEMTHRRTPRMLT